MGFKLTEHKKFILAEKTLFTEALNTEDKPLIRTFQEIISATQKYSKIFVDNTWNPDIIPIAKRTDTLTKFLDTAKKQKVDTKCPTAEKLWQAYYSWIWDNNDFILSIKVMLREQLTKLGWTSDTNPFITYLYYILNNKATYKDITSGAYAAIHNLYSKNIVTAKQLVGTDKLSLIYSPTILKETGGNDVYRLIEKCYLLLKNTQKQLATDDFKSDPEVQQKLISFCFFEQPGITDIDNITWETFKKFITSSYKSYTDPAAQLRSDNEIETIILKFGIKSTGQLSKKMESDLEAQEFWETIKESSIGLDTKHLETLFYYLTLRQANSTKQFNAWSEQISKALLGGAKELQNQGDLITNLDLFNQFIKGIDITEFSNFLNLILKKTNIPEDLRIADSKESSDSTSDTK